MHVELSPIKAREILLSYDGANNYIINLKDYLMLAIIVKHLP